MADAADAAITFTLDGKEVTAEPGETIWDVSKGNGFSIPHLCHSDQPGYRADGNCRACMVEIEGERVLAASCIRTPTPGMVVKTRSERATKARKMVMELLVADQPARETAHDRSSHLWDMAVGPGRHHQPLSRRSSPTASRSSTPATSPCASTSTPASTATSASAPAARCRSTT